MYELLCRSPERPWAATPRKLDCVPDTCNPEPLILHMQENRSHLSQEARACFSVIGILLMVSSIGLALYGYWLVPVYSILAMAVLTFALERHGNTVPAHETLELADGWVRHRDSTGHEVELPAFWMRLTAEGESSTGLRLLLQGQDGTIEFGRCLSLDERRAIVPMVAAALAQMQRG